MTLLKEEVRYGQFFSIKPKTNKEQEQIMSIKENI
jgi:hypothetical protein